MKAWIISAMIAFGLASCASYRLSDVDRLALYEAHAGAPVQRINYVTPIGWVKVDDQHIALDMRPGESWLLTLSGPCLQWNGSSQAISLSPTAGIVLSKFDQVHFSGAQMSCRIEEIRPIDVKALRDAERALRARH